MSVTCLEVLVGVSAAFPECVPALTIVVPSCVVMPRSIAASISGTDDATAPHTGVAPPTST